MSLNIGPPPDALAALAGFNAKTRYRRRLAELDENPVISDEIIDDICTTYNMQKDSAMMAELSSATIYWTRNRLKKALLAEETDPEVINYPEA